MMMKIFNSNKMKLKRKGKGRIKVKCTQESIFENGKTYTVKTYTTPTKLKSVGFKLFYPVVYYYHGRIHREVGPAVEAFDDFNRLTKVRIWFKEGKMHNDFGAAIKVSNGDYVYYKNGRKHRPDNLPALETDEKREYYVFDHFHRTNGPAVEYKDPKKSFKNEFWIHGKKLSNEGVINFDRKNKLDDILSGENEPLEILSV